MKDNYDLNDLRSKPKRVNSRRKGNNFENKVCKILNARFNTDEFCRAPGSGAFATTHTLPKHLQIYGDLITPQNFRFTIECKKGYNKQNFSHLFNYDSDIWKFVHQAERDARKADKEPLVVYQQDRQPIFCIAPLGIFPGSAMVRLTGKSRDWEMRELDELLSYDDSLWL